MNYIAEINAFYDWLETNQLSSNAINLWHALMATANKASWINRFTVAISVLECKTGLKARTIERARNELQQKGRISWKRRNGNQSAEYSIISLCDKKRIKSDAQSVGQSVGQVDAQVVDINKLNETKLFNINGRQVSIEEKYHSVLAEMQNDRIWFEPLCMNIPIKEELFQEKLIEFFVLRTNEGLVEIPILQECKQYFANWIRRDILNAKTPKAAHAITNHNNNRVYEQF